MVGMCGDFWSVSVLWAEDDMSLRTATINIYFESKKLKKRKSIKDPDSSFAIKTGKATEKTSFGFSVKKLKLIKKS